MVSKGWLYAFFVVLAQTCNPYYEASFNDENTVEIPTNAFEYEDEPIFEDQMIEEEPPPPPPPPSPSSSPEEEIFKIVENMPRFPGCEDQGLGRNELNQCAQQKMVEYIGANLKYPKIAKENGVEGRVIIQFVVEKNGDISNVRILRDPGAGCGQEAKRVVENMPQWIPGKQRGKPVKVQYTLPVAFKIPATPKKKD